MLTRDADPALAAMLRRIERDAGTVDLCETLVDRVSGSDMRCSVDAAVTPSTV